MCLNNVKLLRKFIQDTNEDTVFEKCSKLNERGCNPLMTAAVFKSRDALLILLKHISGIALMKTDKKKKTVEILHHSKRSLLSLVMDSNCFGDEIIDELVECEGYLHDWDTTEFQDCLFKFLGTNKKSVKCKDIFKDKNREEKGISKTKKALALTSIIIAYLAKMRSATFDVGTDVALLIQYGSTFIENIMYPISCNSSEVNQECQESVSITEFQISSKECFLLTFGPIILCCMFNFTSAIEFLKKTGRHFSKSIKFLIMVFSPLWLLLTSVYGAFEEMENKLNLKLKKQVFHKAKKEKEEDTVEDDVKNDTDDDASKWINESKMIEVCTEASLQPILQLYLFTVSILSTKNLYSSCISLWTVVQVLSFASSLLSIPRAFTFTYSLNKHGMMTTEAQMAYFFFLFSGVLSRILSFELLAFTSGHLWVVFAAIGVHVSLVAILDSIINKFNPPNDEFWQTVFVIKNHLINAMSNIYIPWSDGRNEEHDVTRHLLVEVIILAENLAISIWAAISSIPLIEENKNKYLAAIWGCYGCYIVVKMGFYLYLHPWADLIKRGIKTSFLSLCKKDPKEAQKAKPTEGKFVKKTFETDFLYLSPTGILSAA